MSDSTPTSLNIASPKGPLSLTLSSTPIFSSSASFSFLLPLSQHNFTKNMGIPCDAYPAVSLENLESQKMQFWTGGAFLVKVANVGKSELGDKAWAQEGDVVYVQLRGPFRRAIAFYDQDGVVRQAEKGDLPKEEVFEPTQDDFALLNDLHVMTMHRGG